MDKEKEQAQPQLYGTSYLFAKIALTGPMFGALPIDLRTQERLANGLGTDLGAGPAELDTDQRDQL